MKGNSKQCFNSSLQPKQQCGLTRQQQNNSDRTKKKHDAKKDINSNQQASKEKQSISPITNANYSHQPHDQEIQLSPRQSEKTSRQQSTHESNNFIEQKEYSTQYLEYCDYIQLKETNNYLVLSKFSTYFGKFNIQTSQKQGEGIFLLRYFDRNFNSSYFHYEGQFQNDEIVGRGKLFIQKSKIILQEGEWQSIKKNYNIHLPIAIKPSKPKIKIFAVTDLITGIKSNKIYQERKFYCDISTAFHDQLLNQRDLTILKSTNWLNSSIIDAYVEHLNYKDEEHYWTLSMEQRKQYKRLYIVPSWLFSWFHSGQEELNLQYFKQIYAQFEPIKYRIWEIYKNIGFIINSNNVHWYFVQLDFDTREIIIKDSMRNSQCYSSTTKILQNLFKQIDKSVEFIIKVCQQCPQQRNGYDCGAYTCIYAKVLAEGSCGKINDGTEMRKHLLQFIQN